MSFRDIPFRNVLYRFSFLILLPILIWLGLALTLPSSTLAALCDGVVFFLAVYSLAAYSQRTTGVFQSSGPMDSLEWLVMAIFYIAIGAIMAVLWSVRWRASGHLPTFGEDQLRAGFRYVASLGLASLVISQGDYQTRVPPRRWITLASLIVAALAIVALGLYSDQISDNVSQFIHDRAPALGSGSHVS